MLNYIRTGSGDVVVLQHGLLSGPRYWMPQINHLRRYFDVIAPDLPGFAGSYGRPVPDSITGFCAALVAFLDRLGVERFSMVGHSMGGMMAQEIATTSEHRLDKLVLFGTALSGELPGRFEPLDESLARLSASGLGRFTRDLAATWFAAGTQSPFYEFCLACGEGTSEAAATAAMRAVRAWKAKPQLSDIDVPTLVICGDRDRGTVPDTSLALWRTIKQSQLAILPGCAHNAHLDNPDLFNLVVGEFLLGR